jgi:hypothetical protein
MGTVSSWDNIAAHIATCLAALLAAWWFLFTANYRRKIEFRVHCSPFRHPNNANETLIELVFELENKGQREDHCYTLAYEVQSVDPEHQNSPAFTKRSGNIVPSQAEYYYVRAGVTQRISDRLWIPASISLIRVKAFMLYEHRRHEISVDRDLFKEMLKFSDWTVVDRVFQVQDSSPVKSPEAVQLTINTRC